MLQAGKYDHLDEIYFEGLLVGWKNMVGGENEDGSSYEDSTDFNDSFDETDGEGHLVKRESRYPRFSENHDVPQFSLGMKFTDKQQFKEAIIKYGLHEKKLIRFKKDDLQRVRAVCDWLHAHGHAFFLTQPNLKVGKSLPSMIYTHARKGKITS